MSPGQTETGARFLLRKTHELTHIRRIRRARFSRYNCPPVPLAFFYSFLRIDRAGTSRHCGLTAAVLS